MKRYCKDIYSVNEWLKICDIYENGSYNTFKIGDKVKCKKIQGTVEEIRSCSKWKLFPCTQFVGISGDDNLYLNTYLELQ